MKIPLLSTPMRHFAAVAEAGSISAAAQRLHVAGSAVSRQVAALEDALGVVLFERARRGMRLTPAGERLAAHLRETQASAQAAVAAVRGQHDVSARLVRLACTDGFTAGRVPEALAAFRAAWPEALLRLAVVSPDDVLALLGRQEADIGLVYTVEPARGCTVHLDAAAPLVALMRAGHPLARQRRLTVADAVRHPMLLGAPGTTARTLFEAACAEQGLVPLVAVVSNALAPMLPLIGPDEIALAGYATATQRIAPGELVAVPFAPGELPPRRLQLLTWRGRALSAPVRACVDALADALRETRSRPRSTGRAAPARSR